jgi:hypothetical protein
VWPVQTHTRSQRFVSDKDESPVLLGKAHIATSVEYAIAVLNRYLTTFIHPAAAQEIKKEDPIYTI